MTTNTTSFSARAGTATANLVGKTGGLIWVGICRVGEGAGEFGTAFVEQTPVAFNAVLAAEERRKTLRAAQAAALAAAAQQQPAVAMTPTA